MLTQCFLDIAKQAEAIVTEPAKQTQPIRRSDQVVPAQTLQPNQFAKKPHPIEPAALDEIVDISQLAVTFAARPFAEFHQVAGDFLGVFEPQDLPRCSAVQPEQGNVTPIDHVFAKVSHRRPRRAQ